MYCSQIQNESWSQFVNSWSYLNNQVNFLIAAIKCEMFIELIVNLLFCSFFKKSICMCRQGLLDRGKIFVHNLVQKVGFFGILLCASVSLKWFYFPCVFSGRMSKKVTWLGETSPKWPILCQVGRQTTTQSISQAMTRTCQPLAVLESGSVNQRLKLIELCASDLNLILFDSAVKWNRSFVCYHFLSSG